MRGRSDSADSMAHDPAHALLMGVIHEGPNLKDQPTSGDAQAPSVLPKANLWFDGGGRRIVKLTIGLVLVCVLCFAICNAERGA